MSSILDDFFNNSIEVDSNSTHPNYGKSIDVIEFPTVHRADNEPVNLIWPDIDHGPWIAGGAALRWYQGLPVGENDIDVFCADTKQAADVIENIKSYALGKDV